jgi:hypothetical protein
VLVVLLGTWAACAAADARDSSGLLVDSTIAPPPDGAARCLSSVAACDMHGMHSHHEPGNVHRAKSKAATELKGRGTHGTARCCCVTRRRPAIPLLHVATDCEWTLHVTTHRMVDKAGWLASADRRG